MQYAYTYRCKVVWASSNLSNFWPNSGYQERQEGHDMDPADRFDGSMMWGKHDKL